MRGRERRHRARHHGRDDRRGSCSGEHGVGLGKLEFLEREHGEPALTVMRTLKVALDPRNILNPGKLLPEGLAYIG